VKLVSTNAVQELNFVIRGKAYQVDPGGEVDVDPAHVPFVFARGIQLEMAKPKPEPAPVAVKAEPAKPKLDPKSVMAAIAKPIESK
jgi:hypothetical protein